MVSLRGLQSNSAVTETGSSASMNSETNSGSALTSATESTTDTTTSAATTAPSSSSFTTVTTTKETTVSGEVITTVTTTTSTTSSESVSNTANTTSGTTSVSNTASSTTNNSGAISANSATNSGAGGAASNVSTTTITTKSDENGSSPVTTVTTDNGFNRTSTSTAMDGTTGITTVTTTTEESSTSGSESATASTTTTSDSSTSAAMNSGSSTTTSQGTSSAAGLTSTSSSTGAAMEGASDSSFSTTTTTTNAGVSSTTEGSSTSSTTTTGTSTSSTNGLMNNGVNSVTASTSSSAGAGTSSTTTSTTTDGSAVGNANSATATTTSSGADASSTTTSTTITSSTTGSTNSGATDSGATTSSGESSTTTTSSSTGSVDSMMSSSGESVNSAANSMISSSESSATATSTSSSSSSSSSALASWFISNFENEETQLVVGAKSGITSAGASHQVCDGMPALITRSNTETPNGGCPDELTALNASCTCLTGYSESASSWVFRVTTETSNTTTTTTERLLTQSSSDKLVINTIRPIWVSSSLETLVIEGTRDSPVEIMFIGENRVASSSSLALVQSTSNSSSITTLSLYNLDLNSVAATNSDFVPATVTNLTLQECNISTLGDSFTRNWSSLQYLDLSSNSLDEAYVGGDDALRELNMSYNALTAFQWASLNSSALQALYIQGNNIKDFNVSQTEFEKIEGLTAFTADQPDTSSTCQDGAWKTVHGTTFCVLGASAAAAPDASRSSGSSSDDDSGLGILWYWLIAGAIIVFFLLLLVLWQRRRHSRVRESSPIVSPEAVEPITPKYNANAAFGDALNRDAAAVGPEAVGPSTVGPSAVAGTVGPGAVGAGAVSAGAMYAGYGHSHGNSADHEDSALAVSLASNPVLGACRLDYGEVTLGRCISRGGFGLVFVGSYRGRQVAVKKIRNERDVEREQVEQFVREISLISGLNHPRIVEFIGACWTTPAELSAVTELMERGDLRDVTRRFKRRGYRLTWEAHKTVIALDIAEALVYLHGLSPTVIHRDLKAKNVLLNADMEAKLSDFGIARERSFYDGTEHMTVGIGTSFWIAPEVLLGRDYDERADIYSFGVVLSEIDTDDYPYWNAQHPPQGKVQENEILRMVARGAKRPAFSDDCPPAILELAARCLRADPNERPSASEIVLYLQQLAQDRTSSASFSSMLRPGNSFDFNTRSTNNSSPTRTAPANTIVNLRSPGRLMQQQQAMAVPSSAATGYAAGKRSKKTTTTTTTTKVASSSIGAVPAPSSRLAAAEALAPAHGVVPATEGVKRHVVRTKLPPKGKRTSTMTTTISRRADQGSAGGGHHVTGRSSGSGSLQSFGTESVPSSRSHAGLPYAGPTSPTSLRITQQQRQLSSSSGEEEKRREGSAVGVDHRGQKWVVYEDVKEL